MVVVVGGQNPMRRVTAHERFEWGLCGVCAAKHGQPCDPAVRGFGITLDGVQLGPGEGAHPERLLAAPKVVALVPVGRIR